MFDCTGIFVFVSCYFGDEAWSKHGSKKVRDVGMSGSFNRFFEQSLVTIPRTSKTIRIFEIGKPVSRKRIRKLAEVFLDSNLRAKDDDKVSAGESARVCVYKGST